MMWETLPACKVASFPAWMIALSPALTVQFFPASVRTSCGVSVTTRFSLSMRSSTPFSSWMTNSFRAALGAFMPPPQRMFEIKG